MAIGAKGLGEPAKIPTGAAIANAVYDAIGVRIRHAPMDPGQIVKAIAKANKNNGSE